MQWSDLYQFALTSAEILINRALALDPITRDVLRQMDEIWIEIHVRGVESTCFAAVTPAGIVLATQPKQPTALRVAGTPLDLLALLRSEDNSLVFKQRVVIEGNTEVAQKLRNVLRSARIDWEEWLAKLTGDFIAHQLGQWVRSASSWTSETHQRRLHDAADYLQEERRVLPAPAELAHWMNGVDTLRDDVDRAEARLRRLQRRVTMADEL
jgi:ubiquinone biosynthesis accessory factor UbiJ